MCNLSFHFRTGKSIAKPYIAEVLAMYLYSRYCEEGNIKRHQVGHGRGRKRRLNFWLGVYIHKRCFKVSSLFNYVDFSV